MAAHNVIYTKSTQTNASYPEMDISCMPSRGNRVDLEVEDVRFIDMHRRPHPSRGGDLELEGGINVSL